MVLDADRLRDGREMSAIGTEITFCQFCTRFADGIIIETK